MSSDNLLMQWTSIWLFTACFLFLVGCDLLNADLFQPQMLLRSEDYVYGVLLANFYRNSSECFFGFILCQIDIHLIHQTINE